VTTWHYESGQWAETTFLDDAWPSGRDWDSVRGQLGYEQHFGINAGSLGAFQVELYQRAEPPRYVVEISDMNIVEMVTTGTLPDALDLLARFAPIAAAAEIAAAVCDIRSLTSCGIVTDIMAGIEVNQHAAADQAATERRSRQERHRAALERKAQA
jgi:hypothetical protein